jgi:signal transduction histidine kinase
VVTGDFPAPDLFVQDATTGVYIEGNKTTTFTHHLGDLIEVEGITGPGKFAPVILELKSRVLGSGTLPKARLYTLSELADGQQDSQWMKVRGIVRSVSIDSSSWRETTLAMNIASAGGEFKARVPISQEQDFSSWVDKEVLIEGVCGTLFNSERQFIGVLFYVPRLNFIQLETQAKEVPFSALLRFSPDQGTKQRVQVRGVVTYQQRGNALFLQDQGRGLRVLTQQDSVLEIGDVVDVHGFPAVGESAPVLADAVFHRVDHVAAPEPVKLDLTAPWERFDGTLVTTEARLLQYQQRPDGLNLVIQQDGTLFEANLPPESPVGHLFSIPLNSELRITGICLVRAGGMWRGPESFRLLLRTPSDVVILHTPSWWNLSHTLWVLGITAGILLAMTAWNVVLGRRVHEQMAIIRQKLRSGAVLEERNRIARELHDTLEQELAGITMQLDLAVDCFQHVPDVAQRALEMARKMSRHSMVAARRSVWDLRCHLLENGDLVSALSQAVEPMAVGDHVKVDVKVEGQPRRLASAVEMNLLRIGQEAVANAVKHARARQITVRLQYAPKKICLCVSDDGRGFSLDDASLAGNGHFGLVDMHERAQSLGCSLQIESQPGSGTRIEVELAAGSNQPTHEEPKIHTYSGS